MPRPKGSKNKTSGGAAKLVANAGTISQQIDAAEKTIATLQVEIEKINVDLKAKKAELKAVQKTLTTLQKKEAAAMEAEMEAQRQAEAKKVAEALLASGKSMDEILAALQ